MNYRPSYAAINLGVIRNNFLLSGQLAPASKQLAVIKADAYGHGAIEVAGALADLAPAFAVAFIDEALALREAGITTPILIMEGCFRVDELCLAAENNFWLMFHSPQQIEMLERTPLPSPLTGWLKVDTGMHRLGIGIYAVPDMLKRMLNTGKLAQIPVLASHMANAEQQDDPFNQQQINQLSQLGATLNTPVSMANSAALMQLPASHLNWNRPGIMLYGCSPLSARAAEIGLKPAMTLYSEIMAIRDIQANDAVGYGGQWRATQKSRIATLPIGYADGYPRSTESRCEVFIHGQRAPVIGSISMDMLGVDISHIPQARVGDRVEVWGENIPVTELASQVNTLSYELLTRVNQRLPRQYL